MLRRRPCLADKVRITKTEGGVTLIELDADTHPDDLALIQRIVHVTARASGKVLAGGGIAHTMYEPR